jgi:ring-1,2-phenylacetyl-CoA epoxidase subunit PaaE
VAKFHPLKVKDIVQETADSVSIGFAVPAELKDEYRYKQGQYLTLRFIENGEEIRRSYSICSAPHESGELRVAVKRVKGGKISNLLNEAIATGSEIDVMTPMGTFFKEIDPAHDLHYVLIAGGSGITPMLSILKTVLLAEPASRITLLYANNDEPSIIFRKAIDELAISYKERFKAIHLLAAPPEGYSEKLRGIMTTEKVKELFDTYVQVGPKNEYFICGPIPMMDNVMMVLKGMNVPEEQIHIEYFAAPATTDTTVAHPKHAAHALATIVKDGDEYEIVMEDETVLQAALRLGLDAPFSCQSGTCATCRAKLLEGEVDMQTSFALTKHDREAGFILTCQARPVTDKIVVDYDQAM